MSRCFLFHGRKVTINGIGGSVRNVKFRIPLIGEKVRQISLRERKAERTFLCVYCGRLSPENVPVTEEVFPCLFVIPNSSSEGSFIGLSECEG